MTFAFLFIFIALQNKAGWDILNFLTVSFSGLIGGFAGGFSRVLSMLTLRPYAPSIFGNIYRRRFEFDNQRSLGMLIRASSRDALVIGVISTQNEFLIVGNGINPHV
jgi:hypothetical protein